MKNLKIYLNFYFGREKAQKAVKQDDPKPPPKEQKKTPAVYRKILLLCILTIVLAILFPENAKEVLMLLSDIVQTAL